MAGGLSGCEPPAPAAAPAAVDLAAAASPAALDPPAALGAFAPSWATVPPADGDPGSQAAPLFLSWLEPRGNGGHRVRTARLPNAAHLPNANHDDGSWSPATTVVEGDDFFANWADVPRLAALDGRRLVAAWLAKNGDSTYAYGVQLAASDDGGASWRRQGLLHDDDSPTEHGFVSLLPAAGGVRAIWLDGRATAGGGSMQLRSRWLDLAGGELERGAEEEIDPRVCECCPTDATALGAAEMTAGSAAGGSAADGSTGGGSAAVVYRDRGATEVRDISIARRSSAGNGWSAPATVAADGWQLPGCPVNGPAIATLARARDGAGDGTGGTLAVAWFTAEPQPRVLAAFSADGGATFGPPLVVDGERPLGRVDLVADGAGGALISWLAVVEEEGETVAELRLAGLTPPPAADSAAPPPPDTAPPALGTVTTVARTSAGRASGFPRLARRGDRLYVAWTEVGAERNRSRLRVSALAGDRR